MTWEHEGSRHERGYGYEWTKRRALVLQRDGYLCQVCLKAGRPTPANEVDHILPKSLNGTDNFDNLQAICAPCHSAKTTAENKRSAKASKFDANGWPIW